MQNKRGICAVCAINEAIGVASTVMPYSCAYCVECARRFAQPMLVFEHFFEEYGTRFDELAPWVPELEAFIDGRYVSYRDYANARASKGAE